MLERLDTTHLARVLGRMLELWVAEGKPMLGTCRQKVRAREALPGWAAPHPGRPGARGLSNPTASPSTMGRCGSGQWLEPGTRESREDKLPADPV